MRSRFQTAALLRAGKLLGWAPWGQQAVGLQRALTKALTTCLSLQPPEPGTAVHVLRALSGAEEAARRVAGPQGQPFVTFDDTFVIYSDLLSHRAGAPPLPRGLCCPCCL